MKKALYKVPNGKLLKIFLEETDSCIDHIKITGDFFMHPEEDIELLEDALEGCVIEEGELTRRIQSFFAQHKTKLFGLDQESLVHTIISAN